MGGQGSVIPEATLRNIIQMLSTTDLPVKQIARHTECEPNIVVSINRRFQIRVLTLNRERAPKPEGHFSQSR